MKTVTFEKIVGGGRALGYIDGRPCFADGPLPGEVAEVAVVRDKASFADAQVVRITKPSAQRSETAEDHYLLCSPWQNVDYAFQLQLKRQVLEETFGRPGLELEVSELVGSEQMTGYRNKLEFSLAKDAAGKLALAFHARGSYEELVVTPEGCRLGSDRMNAAALALAAECGALGLGEAMVSLTVRQSLATGAVVGVVGLDRRARGDFSPLLNAGLEGVVVSQVVHRNGRKMLWHGGETGLTERVGGLELGYPYDGFFQTNPAMFERALEQILAVVPAGGRAVDLYGGVGTIGLAAAGKASEVVGVEAHVASAEWASGNADRNGILNYQALAVSAEGLDVAVLRDADCVVVDPPRAGLHVRVVDALLEAKPKRIVYLSCNPATQARDVMMLKESYNPGKVTGFDFYPGTLHLESLVVLDRH